MGCTVVSTEEIFEAAIEIERLRIEIVRLRRAFERILLDVKFMTEKDVVPAHILDDFIYQEALTLMTDDFLKEFNND